MAIPQNTYKEKSAPTGPKKKRSWVPVFSIDRRIQVGVGIFLQALTCFCGIAFMAHIWHGAHDQAVIASWQELGVKEAGKLVHNWLGFVGAWVGYHMVFRWLGVTAFLILPISYLLGARLLRSRLFKGIGLYNVSLFCLFFILWLNAALGYADVLFPNFSSTVSWLLGGVAFELGIILNGLLGWGTLIFLLASLLIFLVCFFNITSVQPFFSGVARLAKWPQGLFSIKKVFAKKNNMPPAASRADTVAPFSPLAQSNDVKEKAMESSSAGLSFDMASKADGQEQQPVVGVPLSIVQPAVDENGQEGFSIGEEASGEVLPGYSSPGFAADKGHGLETDYDPALDLRGYQYPTAELLDERDHAVKEVSQEELEQNKDRIVKTLIDFKIGIGSIKATIGPTVTLYEIVPEAGVKISRIKNLEDDIALSLSALGIRIIAPIPGKGTIGIEVPNKNRSMVPFKDLLVHDRFTKSNMELPIILGKSIANETIVMDLVRMPHLLIAGATGQGKSVGLNVLLASLIYKKHPSQLKLVLVDPKKVELSLYSHLEKHFLAKLPSAEEPIITETKKVVNTLQSLCIEMDARYELLKQAGTRNIKEYNDKFIRRRLNPEKGHRFLPYMVLVIDEFADMMMTAGKEVEMPIARLAQLARAIGIHLVLATQRPSVNVITGIIKANFPVRVSFRVTSKVDSRTILDTGGAEQLVGQGDMLLSMNSSVMRLQCPFLDTQEIERICAYIAAQPGYSSAYLLPDYEEGEEGMGLADVDLGEQDPLFEEAARLIVLTQQGSTSLIQRKLKLGYNRAGRLMDQLEATGIVGPAEGSKPREVLFSDEQVLDRFIKSRNSNR